MITITPGMTTADLIAQITAAGGLAVVAHDGWAWPIATPPPGDSWNPTLHVLGHAPSNRTNPASDTDSDRDAPAKTRR